MAKQISNARLRSPAVIRPTAPPFWTAQTRLNQRPRPMAGFRMRFFGWFMPRKRVTLLSARMRKRSRETTANCLRCKQHTRRHRRTVERRYRLPRPILSGRDPSKDHRELQGRLQPCEDKPEQLHRRLRGTRRGGRRFGQDVEQRLYHSGRGDYKGAFANLAQEVNMVHRRVTHLQATMKNISKGNFEDLPEYKRIGRRCEGDELMPTLIGMMESLNCS